MFRCANTLSEAGIQMPPRNPPALTVSFLQLDSPGDNLRVVGSKTTWGPKSFFEPSLSSNSHACPSDHDHAASHDTFSAWPLKTRVISPRFPDKPLREGSPIPSVRWMR